MILKCCIDQDDVTSYVIAKELGMSVQAVQQYLKRRGVESIPYSGYNGKNRYPVEAVKSAYKFWRRRFC